MSLRVFHIVFITVCLLLMIYVGVWGISKYMADRSGSALALGLAFIVFGFVLLEYGRRTFRKLKELP
jgi:hypothetical protein